MDYPALQLGYNVLQGALTIVLFFYTRRLARQKATEERFERLEQKIADVPSHNDFIFLKSSMEADCKIHQGRTATVETHLAELKVQLVHMPSQRQIDDLNRSIQALCGDLRATQGRLEGINRAVDLINEYLIKREA